MKGGADSLLAEYQKRGEATTTASLPLKTAKRGSGKAAAAQKTKVAAQSRKEQTACAAAKEPVHAPATVAKKKRGAKKTTVARKTTGPKTTGPKQTAAAAAVAPTPGLEVAACHAAAASGSPTSGSVATAVTPKVEPSAVAMVDMGADDAHEFGALASEAADNCARYSAARMSRKGGGGDRYDSAEYSVDRESEIRKLKHALNGVWASKNKAEGRGGYVAVAGRLWALHHAVSSAWEELRAPPYERRHEERSCEHACLDKYDSEYGIPETFGFLEALASRWARVMVSLFGKQKMDLNATFPKPLQDLLGNFNAATLDGALAKAGASDAVIGVVKSVRQEAVAAEAKREAEKSTAWEAKKANAGRRGIDCCYFCRGPHDGMSYPMGEDCIDENFCFSCYEDAKDGEGADYSGCEDDFGEDEDGYGYDSDDYGY